MGARNELFKPADVASWFLTYALYALEAVLVAQGEGSIAQMIARIADEQAMGCSSFLSAGDELLAEDVSEGLLKRRPIPFTKAAKLPQDQTLCQRCENGFDDGGLQEACLMSLHYREITKVIGGVHLAGHRHEDNVRTVAIAGRRTHNDRRALLGGRLIGEGKRHEDNVAEFIVGHSRHRPGCPTLVGMRSQKVWP